MSNPTSVKPTPSVSGDALSLHIGACLQELLDKGYAEFTVDRYRCSLRHFSHWLARNKIGWCGREEASVHRFLTKHLPTCDCSKRYTRNRRILSPALHHLLRFLRAHGYISACEPVAGTIEEEVQRFDTYLARVCGFSPKTRQTRTHFVRRFLFWRNARGQIDIASRSPRHIRQFLMEVTQGWKRGSVASTLRGITQLSSLSRVVWRPYRGAHSRSTKYCAVTDGLAAHRANRGGD
jgi:site-specific recombinase XerD